MSTPVTVLAEGCVRAVSSRLAEKHGKTHAPPELDYSPETLPILDLYVSTVRDDPSTAVLAAPMCGAYFGEVVRSAFGGMWQTPDAYEEWTLSVADGGLSFNPLGAAMEALAKKEAPGWGAHLKVTPERRAEIETKLSALGDVQEEDYFRLSVRFEVVEHICTQLILPRC